MNIDTFWLDDAAMARISCQTPSTPSATKFMEDVGWIFRGLDVSDTYRGYVIVLSALSSNIRSEMSLHDIEQLIESVRQSLLVSQTLPSGTARVGGASLAATNAWEYSHAGISTQDFIAACEAQLIYAAQKFIAARKQNR